MASLCMGSRRAGGSATLLPGSGRSQSCGPGASFVSCSGGLVSTGAGVAVRGKKFNGPMEKMTKEMYASALEEQIAGRKALQPAEETLMLPESCIGDKDELQAAERKLGQRHGGPMAPSSKESYAKALHEQIARRDAHKSLESYHVDDAPTAEAQATYWHEDEKQGKPAGKRCVPPSNLSKESYALALQQQINMRNARRMQEDSEAACDSAAGMAPAEEAPVLRGRRHGGPMTPSAKDKDTYASELQEQIAARDARRASERAASLGPYEGRTYLSAEAHKARGKRHATLIEQPSRMSYMSALQEQMSEKAAERVAEAYHTQVSKAQPTLTAAPDDVQQVKAASRYRGPRAVDTKESYASALREQIQERKVQQEAERTAGKSLTQLPGFLGGPEAFSRGRRHEGQIQSLSKHGLGYILQEQIAERDAQRSLDAFHRQGNGDAEAGVPGSPENADSLARFMSEHSASVTAY